jgi:predicted helicase
VGIAISFLVKKNGAAKAPCEIEYIQPCEIRATREDKFAFLQSHSIGKIEFETVKPDPANNWIDIPDNDFDTLLPIADKKTKSTKVTGQERAIFKAFSFGVVTNRDEWVYSETADSLEQKVKHLIAIYNEDCKKLQTVRDQKKRAELLDKSIKWTRAVKGDLSKGVQYKFDGTLVSEAQYRPFVKRYLYFSRQLNEMQNRMAYFFGARAEFKNQSIAFTDPTSQKPFMVMAVEQCPDMHLVGAAAGSVTLARLADINDRTENITDWALDQFRGHYEVAGQVRRRVSKDAIFHYVYAVLHDPLYREKYVRNLKREFPRIPLYTDFWKWANWGAKLMDLHVGYEAIEPWELQRIDVPEERLKKADLPPRPSLRADKDSGFIVLDSTTQLTCIPPEAWAYKLGNRSALEWVLDQYKEKTPKDPTIREKFNTYRFAEHKVIDLLMRVTRVSVETVKIVEAMRKEKR